MGREVNVGVEGQLVFNTIDLSLEAALDGFGPAYLPTDQVGRITLPRLTHECLA